MSNMARTMLEPLQRQIIGLGVRLARLERREDFRGLTLVKLTTAPTTPVEGRLYWADGTSWNPGSGEGIYMYRNAAYVFIG